MILFPQSTPLSCSSLEADNESLSIEKVDISVSIENEEKKISPADAYGRGYAKRKQNEDADLHVSNRLEEKMPQETNL